MVRRLCTATYRSCLQHNQLNNAAALSFYFLLSLSPLMIFLVSLMAHLPFPGIKHNVLLSISRIAPLGSMSLVHGVVTSVFESHRRLISVGGVGAVWAASTGFTAMIGALNQAYFVKEARPFWRRELVAVGLTIVVGAMLVTALLLAVGGTRIGFSLAGYVGMDSVLAAAWPLLRWVAVVVFAAAGAEMLYCMAPNLKQRPLAQIPGVIVAVTLWLVSSASLGAYLRHFGHLTAINATVGSVSALMLWCFFGSLAILIGAEVNSQAKIIRAQHGKRGG